jgi:hypothetical protein
MRGCNLSCRLKHLTRDCIDTNTQTCRKASPSSHLAHAGQSGKHTHNHKYHPPDPYPTAPKQWPPCIPTAQLTWTLPGLFAPYPGTLRCNPTSSSVSTQILSTRPHNQFSLRHQEGRTEPQQHAYRSPSLATPLKSRSKAYSREVQSLQRCEA